MTSTHAMGLLLAALVAGPACAQFALQSPYPLEITFGDEPLIIDRSVAPEIEGAPSVVETQADGWESLLQVWHAAPGSRMRQEIALRSDRIELTHLRIVDPDITGSQSAGLLLTHGLLDGARVEIIGTPQPAGSATADGRVFAGKLGENGVRSIKYLKFLRLHTPAGPIDFDCNPRGFWVGSYNLTKAASRWSLSRTDDGWLLVAAHGKSRRGALHDAKLVISTGSTRPVDEVHPVARTRWTDPYTAAFRVNMGATPVPKYEMCVTQTAGDDWAASWSDAESLRPERDERFVDVSPVRVEGVALADPEKPARLRMRVERDGWYLVSLLVGSADRAMGPCDLFAGHGEPRTTPTVAAGEYGSWPVIARATDGLITVSITGNCRVVAAQAAVMMYANEDYLVERSWWVSEDFHPDDDLPL